MFHLFTYIHTKIDQMLKIPQSEKAVKDIKQNTTEQVDIVTETLKKQGELQQKVIQKTTTYYMAQAAGLLKK